MTKQSNILDNVSAVINALPKGEERLIVAVAGPPAVGKSTLAECLVKTLNQDGLETAALLPMDGFHLDNAVLEENGTLERKGSPNTFDFDGFQSILIRIKGQTKDHFIPTFDRSRDIAVAGSAVVRKGTRIVIVEGNYLLLDGEPWSGLSSCFDHRVFVEAPLIELRSRLIQRWLYYGYDEEAATSKAEFNDIPNAQLVLESRGEADQTLRQSNNK